jgi:hypothetical protein
MMQGQADLTDIVLAFDSPISFARRLHGRQ